MRAALAAAAPARAAAAAAAAGGQALEAAACWGVLGHGGLAKALAPSAAAAAAHRAAGDVPCAWPLQEQRPPAALGLAGSAAQQLLRWRLLHHQQQHHHHHYQEQERLGGALCARPKSLPRTTGSAGVPLTAWQQALRQLRTSSGSSSQPQRHSGRHRREVPDGDPWPWPAQEQQQQQQQQQPYRERGLGPRSQQRRGGGGGGGSGSRQRPAAWQEADRWQQGWREQRQQQRPEDAASKPPRGGAGSAPQRPKGPPPSAITRDIGGAESLQELKRLLEQHAAQLQQIHVCAAFKAVVRLAAAEGAVPPGGGGGGGGGGGAPGARAGPLALAVMRDLSARMQAQVRVARPWDLAQAAWACSKLQYRDLRLLDAIAEQAQRKAPILLPQDVAQLASAYARLRYAPPRLMALLQQQAAAKAAELPPWSLVHTAWALHTSGADCAPLLAAAAERLPGQLGGLQPLDIATLLWLMAGRGAADRNAALLGDAADHVAAGAARYPPAALAQALASLAALGAQGGRLAAAAREELLRRGLASLSPRQVAQCTFAAVRLGGASPRLMDEAAEAFCGSPAAYGPPLLCMMAWALLLGSGQPRPQFSEALARQAAAQLPRFSADQLASILRALYRTPDWQQLGGVAALVADVCAALPAQAPRLSTPVLTQLLVTLSKEWQQAAQAGAAGAEPPAAAAAGVAEQPPQGALQQGPLARPEAAQLLRLVEQCGQEWLRGGRRADLAAAQAAAVQAAFARCGLAELAEAAGQVAAELEERQAGARSDGGLWAAEAAAAAGPAGPSAAADGGGVHEQQRSSWLDSFVAVADDAPAPQAHTS